MKTFISFFIFEFKRFVSRKNIVVLLLFSLLALYFVSSGINHYRNIKENKEKFQEIEKLKVQQYINYNQYGKYGFRLLFIPSPLSIMFDNSGAFSELTCNIDSGEILRIYKSRIGKSLYDKKPGGFKDFSGIILILGSLFALYFGYESIRHKEYLRFLSCFSNHKGVFFSILFSRIILLVIFFLFLTGCSVILLKLNGIILSQHEYSLLYIYLTVLFCLLLFFFVSGTAIGSFKKKSISIITIISLWFVLMFLIPGIVDTITYKKAAGITSSFHIELEKLKALMNFEKRAIDKEGRFKSSTRNSDEVRELVESYRDKEFKAIKEFEKKMEQEMRDNANFFQKLSLFFPSTFYLSTCSEMSSRGYNTFIDFYQDAQKLKDQFVRFYINRVYYSNYSKVESFIKGDDNIYYAGSRLPGFFIIGLVLNGFYIILLLFVSYSRFKNFLFYPAGKEKETPRLNELIIKLEKGKCTVCVTSSQQIRDLILGFLSGQGSGFTGTIEVDGTKIQGGEKRKEFVYLPHPDNIPGDIRAANFITLCRRLSGISGEEAREIEKKLDMKKIAGKKFNDLEDITKGSLLFTAAQLKKGKIYLINEIEKGMPQAYTNRLMKNLQKLKKEDVGILYLSSNLYFTAKVSEKMIVPGDERIENILK